MSRVGVLLLAAGAVTFSWACGSSSLSPSDTQVSGAWWGNSTLVAATGGECVGATLQAVSGARDVFTTALKQTGSTLEATIASPANGTSCAYSGTINGSTLALTLTACQTDRVTGVRCGSGALRDLQLISGSITVDVGARTAGTGTDTTSWNVFTPGGTTRLGGLTLTASFAWRFLGLPSSDYHVFTGTIFPGYADGTISIEADEGFCSPCGWFPH